MAEGTKIEGVAALVGIVVVALRAAGLLGAGALLLFT